MSKVSVVIPAYNQARFLDDAIRSVLVQSHEDVEVIVIDDGSTDTTREVAESFNQDSRFTYVYQSNSGLPRARNRGIRESSGDYLCFLDSDDYYHPDKIRRQVKLLDDDPSMGFVYCDIIQVDETRALTADQYAVGVARSILSGNIFESLLIGGFFPPHTVMVRRSVLDEAGLFEPDLGGHADYELWLRLSGRGYRACYIDEKLAYYRRHQQSMSKDSLHMNASLLDALRIVVRQFPDQVAGALASIQHADRNLYVANEWLRKQWEAIMARMDAQEEPGGKNGNISYSLVSRFREARQLVGSREQMALWDVTTDGKNDRVLFMQPPARSLFVMDNGAEGTFKFAVMIHPDAWEKSGAGCGFDVTVDGRVALSVESDPRHRHHDRRWSEFMLGIPKNPSGCHEIMLETRGLGGSVDFRWALWRDLRFTPSPPIASKILERNACEQP